MTAARPVLVTRAEPGATLTCERLAALGYPAVNAATARIAATEGAPDWTGAGGVIVTSPNGAGQLSRLGAPRTLKVFAVGPASAAAARAAGHEDVVTGSGDAAGLLDILLNAPDPGRLIHVRGRDQALDLSGALQQIGRDARSHIAYEARPVEALPAPALSALGPGAVVLLHSPLGAERLVALVEAAGRLSALGAAHILAISDAAAGPLRHSGAGHVTVAQRPDEAALFEALSTILAPGKT
ncbi:uroporphyrinogen-III synthase [Hyphomonadaceae bacterium BL14]|nr:uroporphyrinogen-III synthase [Hyphomonadaceae bacterium BL14]